MSDLSQKTRALLDAAEGADDPTAADRERVRAGLAARIAAGAAVGAAGVAAGAKGAQAAAKVGGASGVGSGVGSGVAAKIVVASVIVAGLGAGAWRMLRPAPAAAPVAAGARVAAGASVPAPAAPAAPVAVAAAVPAAAPAADAAADAAVPSVPVPPPSPSATPPRAAHVKREGQPAPAAPAAPAAPPATLEREVATLRTVRSALHDGDAATALATLDTYAHEFPAGALSEEADALRVEALCALHRRDEATQAAASFLERHPQSLHAARVARGCAAEEGEVAP